MKYWRMWRCGMVALVSGGLCTSFLLLPGCNGSSRSILGFPVQPDPSPPARADTAYTLTRTAEPRIAAPLVRPKNDVVLTTLYVRLPHAARDRAKPLWNYLREDLFDNDTVLRLRRNGIRVGVGQEQSWEALKAVFDAIDGAVSAQHEPMAMRAAWPLALEFDSRPRDQTVFFVGTDGVLTGDSWPRSRTVLRLTVALDPDRPKRVLLTIVPEVRQELGGWRWVRSESGLAQVPEYNGRAYGAAGFVAGLLPGEFLLIAPGDQAEVYGMIGGALLMSEIDGERYDSLVFLRADAGDGDKRQ